MTDSDCLRRGIFPLSRGMLEASIFQGVFFPLSLFAEKAHPFRALPGDLYCCCCLLLSAMPGLGCVKRSFPDHLMKAKEEMSGGSPSPCWWLTLVPGGECGTKARESPEAGRLREWDTEMVQ